ncbi:MAG: hypothetical protein SGARI_005907 [Bacillariaceae sp.]
MEPDDEDFDYGYGTALNKFLNDYIYVEARELDIPPREMVRHFILLLEANVIDFMERANVISCLRGEVLGRYPVFDSKDLETFVKTLGDNGAPDMRFSYSLSFAYNPAKTPANRQVVQRLANRANIVRLSDNRSYKLVWCLMMYLKDELWYTILKRGIAVREAIQEPVNSQDISHGTVWDHAYFRHHPETTAKMLGLPKTKVYDETSFEGEFETLTSDDEADNDFDHDMDINMEDLKQELLSLRSETHQMVEDVENTELVESEGDYSVYSDEDDDGMEE